MRMGIDALGANLTTMVTGRPEAGEENALDGNSCNPIGFTGIHQESRKPEALKSLTQIRAGSRFVLAFALFSGIGAGRNRFSQHLARLIGLLAGDQHLEGDARDLRKPVDDRIDTGGCQNALNADSLHLGARPHSRPDHLGVQVMRRVGAGEFILDTISHTHEHTARMAGMTNYAFGAVLADDFQFDFVGDQSRLETEIQ